MADDYKPWDHEYYLPINQPDPDPDDPDAPPEPPVEEDGPHRIIWIAGSIMLALFVAILSYFILAG